MDINQFQAQLTRLGHTHSHAEITGMWASAPARRPGKKALTNTTVLFHSQKNKTHFVLESHTIKRHLAYKLEFDDDVLAYTCQVPCRQIERTTAKGRRNVLAGHVDFLVVGTNGVELVECKAFDAPEKLVEDSPNEYVKIGGEYTRPAYQPWAEQREMRYAIWTPPQYSGVLLRNLEVMYCAKRFGPPDERTTRRVRALLDRTPLTAEELCTKFACVSPRDIAHLLASSELFGPLGEVPLDEMYRLTVFSNAQQAQWESDRLRHPIEGDVTSVQSTLTTARRSELIDAQKRLNRVREYQAGRIPSSTRLRAWARRVNEAETAGEFPLGACLPAFGRKGNRLRRYAPGVDEIIEATIKSEWGGSKAKTLKAVTAEVRRISELVGVQPPGRWIVEQRIRSRSRPRRDLATSGRRGFHAHRPPLKCARALG